jgi:hypothetical protein
MIIGSHEMKGVIETLKQSFCVLQKKKRLCTEASDNDNSTKTNDKHQTITTPLSTLSSTTNSSSLFHIVGVVSSKIIFNKYPKTIVRKSK